MSAYAFNPTGVSGPNNVSGEIQALTPTGSTKYNYLIPRFGPFFLNSLTVTVTATAQGIAGALSLNTPVVLTPFVDYFPVLEFITATVACAQGIYGAIQFVDPALVGTVTLSYLSLGGDYVMTSVAQTALIQAQAIDPRLTCYEDAFNLTTPFPVVTLPIQEQSMVTFTNVISVMGDIATLLGSASPPYSPVNFETHIHDLNNPHKDTAATFHLDLVPNWSIASTLEAQTGVVTNRFVTPALAGAALSSSTVSIPASSTLFGIAKLNLGGQAGDGADATKALTTAGLNTLKTAGTANAIKTLFAYERQVLTFSLSPIPYPVLYQGTRCANWRDLINAVQTYLNFSPVEANWKLNCIYLPWDIAAPPMTITATT